MGTRTRWSVFGMSISVFILHAGLLLFSFVLGMSGVAAHGPTATSPDLASKIGPALIGVLGFPFLDLALWVDGSALSGWMWVVAGTLTSATWAGIVCWWIARRRRLRGG